MIRLRGFPILGFPVWWKETAGSLIGKTTEKGEISAAHGACNTLAATVGTGNIAGVATALAAGGAGAVFWMWVSAGLGMATAYAETSLAQKYRDQDETREHLCGPMLYMERGLGSKWMGVVYAVFAVASSLGMGSMVQANAVCGTIRYHIPVPGWLCGGILTAAVGMVIIGGVRRISKLEAILVPVSAGIYLFFSGIVLLSCLDVLPIVLWRILREALCPRAAVGGAAGYGLSAAVRYGLSRGVFSNEAGLGTIAVLQGSVRDAAPEKQGMWAMFAVFMDTIVLCTLTALVILCASETRKVPVGLNGTAWAVWSFSGRLGGFGAVLISVSILSFAFATITAWYYVGRQMVEYLNRNLVTVYSILYLAAVCWGCMGGVETVWMLADLWNGLMAVPNLVTLLFLSGQVKKPD